ncbi:MAG: type IV pilus twitching motility protein PilT [Deltaproteobacteria bacterium]|jgi:twitching motility protein PilT|nr:type IV pilus twitching motility protein PilT [Deltaproteobacteria bacterium]MCK5420836.1 type IV pilus twitching motility protein PilT [Deltaproteobacteria bacterium]MCK5514650.1 type IV pilus twitching motility protein PilT [Deltaproteobacteria bacterium]NOQ86385.1 PilT/PilU family type 4a pilus ATPase [Deltaproteobacteria bacterium]
MEAAQEKIVDMTELLKFAIKSGASDLHISSGESPMFRIHGDMRRIEMEPLSEEEVHTMIYDILNDQQRKIFEETRELDFSIALGEYGRFRVNVFSQNRGEAAVLRTIPNKVKSFEELVLPRICRSVAKAEKGLVLVTGPTGSGKSTTLATMVDSINASYNKHIITIEDPIEFIHESKKCLVNQREVGEHTHSFANALRSALREDPDVILVGEMRDLETISLALTAAETGHLVFATLHTSSAPKTIDRIVDVFPAGQQAQIRTMLSETLYAVISQILLKRADGTGRIPALEVMICTSAIKNLIRESKTAQILSTLQTSQKYGMQTMEMAVKGLLERKLVSPEEAQPILSDMTKTPSN